MKLPQQHLSTAWALAFCFASLQTIDAGQKVFLGNKNPQRELAYHQLDHHPWDAMLKKYVDTDGLVNYRSWKASPQDLAALDAYISGLSNANPQLKSTAQAKLSFWINAYNAVTLRGMLREYPTTSIRKHTAKLYGYNIWKDLQLYVHGKPYSLDDMEHEVLRKMDEPRIHFAVVCASKGCPRLLNEAYTPDRVEEQLEINAKDFFSRPANFRHQANRIGLSSILKWYGDDFGSNQTAQMKRFAGWLPTKAARQAALSGSARVSYLEYDWSINEQPAKRP